MTMTPMLYQNSLLSPPRIHTRDGLELDQFKQVAGLSANTRIAFNTIAQVLQ